MAKWIKTVEHDDIEDGKTYFIALRPPSKMGEYKFAGMGLNMKECWTIKPGIAHHFTAESARKNLKANDRFVAVEIPKDHATRWRARQRKHF